jgi:pimeloyl-ACP methyl ester carboxylesterase
VKIIVGGQIINCEQMGQGQDLVILHGWGRSIGEWFPIAKNLLGYRVTLIDLPGFGASEDLSYPLDTYGYTHVVLKCIKKLNIERCILMGHSFGGRIATILAAKHSNVVSQIILVDAGGIEIKSVSTRLRILLYKMFLKPLKRIIPTSIKRFFGSSDYKRISGNLQKSFVKIVNQDLRYLFPSIQQPVIVLWGSADEVLPVEYVKIYQKLVPRVVTRIIWGADHSPHISRSRDFMSVLSEVLQA